MTQQQTTQGPHELRDLATTIAVGAAELVARRRRDGVSVAATKTSLVDVVTEVDRESETFIRSALARARPHDGFLGEESGGSGGTSGLTWVVDPIDGTVNFLYGIPAYGVSIAVMTGADPLDGGVVAGVVVNPATGDVWSAARGCGATLNGVDLRVSGAERLSEALVGTGFSYRPEFRRVQGAVVAGVLPRVRDVRRIGAAALDLCAVAAGRLDGYYERWLNPWDFAAGVLIAQEAGAVVTASPVAHDGSRLLIAAAPGVAHQLSALAGSLDDALVVPLTASPDADAPNSGS